MRSATMSFNWSFYSERYLSSTCSLLDQFFWIEINGFQKHCFCCFPVDPIWFSIFCPLATSSLSLAFSMTLRSPVITWPCGSFQNLDSLRWQVWGYSETFKFERAGAKLNNLLATVLVHSYDTIGGSLSLK